MRDAGLSAPRSAQFYDYPFKKASICPNEPIETQCYISTTYHPISVSPKPDIPSGQMMEEKMKNLFFAALAALTLSVAVVPAYAHDFHNGSSVTDDLSATNRQQTGSYGD